MRFFISRCIWTGVSKSALRRTQSMQTRLLRTSIVAMDRPKSTKDLVNHYRDSHPPSLPNLGTSSEKTDTRKTRLQKHFFFRFLDYLGNYEAILKKVLPAKVLELSQLFISGSRLLLADMNEFSWVYNVLSATSDWEKACKTLTRRQLELYLGLPSELVRVAPLLVVSALPLAHNVTFPIALMYPKQLLSSHFWNPAVREEAAIENLSYRQKYYRPLFRDLQKSLLRLKNRPYHHTCKAVLQKLATTNEHPSVDEILELKPAFSREGSSGVFDLFAIPATHIRHLRKAHGRRDYIWWRHRLLEYGNLLRQIDLAIKRENLSALSESELSHCCRQRGLDTQGLSADEMRTYLDKWVAVSSQLDAKSLSLLLHLPILLGYNHKTRLWDDGSVV